MGPTEALFLVILFGLLVALPIWGIVDAALRPNEAWNASGQSKVVGILLQVFLGLIGTALYLLFIRPKLMRPSPAA